MASFEFCLFFLVLTWKGPQISVAYGKSLFFAQTVWPSWVIWGFAPSFLSPGFTGNMLEQSLSACAEGK